MKTRLNSIEWLKVGGHVWAAVNSHKPALIYGIRITTNSYTVKQQISFQVVSSLGISEYYCYNMYGPHTLDAKNDLIRILFIGLEAIIASREEQIKSGKSMPSRIT